MYYALALLIAAFVLWLLLRRKKAEPANNRLKEWRDSEEREIKRPRDARTKYCVANVGNPITIKYNRTRRTITPLRLFTKPEFHKTYVSAYDSGELKTFDIDDMTLTKKQIREVVRKDYQREKEAQTTKRKTPNKPTRAPANAIIPEQVPSAAPPEIDWKNFF